MSFFNLFKKKKQPNSHSDFSKNDSKEHIGLNVQVSLEEKKKPNDDRELDYTDL